MESQFSNLSEDEALEVANKSFYDKFQRYVSDVETIIFRGSWQDKTYQQIANDSGYSLDYFRGDAGNKFWQKLSEALGEKVKKDDFKAAIERKWKNYQKPNPPDSPPLNYREETWQKERTYGQFVGRNPKITDWTVYKQLKIVIE
ncbi:hypothetical protein PL11201_80460 [Planktothrix sp. PCC 11201]|uniref:hypothetical protein n=1 Tax=Planktothrix sp. PCC 11201 TaxID=1729650 RepID=UPI0009205B53|nr:hypothetical protein [Planktothrix sp. PCC 11201]SKB16150.1 hypothetical protein PL11201_80460 [Planktothrix sp. PCC 11201]